jgi:hypothetical protein
MNEQNFDKIFGDKLNEGTDFHFTEEKWGKMEKHLDAFQLAQGRKRLLLWLLLPFLALIGLLTWGGWLLKDTQQHVLDLTKEVHGLRLEKQNSPPPSVFSMKNDTVYRHIVVTRYDTIFQTIVRRELTETPQAKANFSLTEKTKSDKELLENEVKKATTINDNLTAFEKRDLVNKKVENERIKATVSDSNKAFSQQKIAEKKEGKVNLQEVLKDENNVLIDSVKTAIPYVSEVLSVKETDSLKASTPLSINDEKVKKSIKNDENGLKSKENEENIDKVLEKQKPAPILKPIKIAGYELGILGGITAMVNPNLIQQNGFSVGLRGGLLLGEKWKIIGETHYLSLSYETDKITPDLNIKIITPPTPNDSLDGVKVKQPYLQYSLGLQYLLSNKRLKPYVGINLLGQSKLEEEIEYEYINTLTNTPVFVQTVRKENLFQLPFLRLQLGASYPILGKINALLEGSYDVKLGTNTQFKPLWQVKTGFFYRF